MKALTKAHKAALVPNAKPTPSQLGWALLSFFATNAERVKAKKAQDYKCVNIPQGWTTKYLLTFTQSGGKKPNHNTTPSKRPNEELSMPLLQPVRPQDPRSVPALRGDGALPTTQNSAFCPFPATTTIPPHLLLYKDAAHCSPGKAPAPGLPHLPSPLMGRAPAQPSREGRPDMRSLQPGSNTRSKHN